MNDAQEFGEKYQIEKRFDDYDALLKDRDIDMVYIGLPNNLHYPFARKALEAGKAAVVEKPFVSDVEQGKDLLDTAKKNHVMLFSAIPTMYNPCLGVLKENLHKAGNLKIVTTTYDQYSHRYDSVRNGEIPGVFDLAKDSGALKDLGIYPVTFNVVLFGKPEEIHYYANHLPNGCDVSGTIVMKYHNFISTNIIAKDSFLENRCTVSGEDGTFFVDNDCFRFPNLRFRKNAQDESEVLKEFNGSVHESEFRHFAEVYDSHNEEQYYKEIETAIDTIDVLNQTAESAGLKYGK